MQDWRPRPRLWRLALVSFCHVVIAAWIANVLIGIAELADVDSFSGAGGIVLAAIIAALWPTRPTLARRHFVYIAAEAVALFPAVRLVVLHSNPLSLGVALVAVIVSAAIEVRAQRLLSNVYDGRFLARVGAWAVRIVPGAAAVGLAAFLEFHWTAFWGCALLVASTLLAVFAKGRTRFEQLSDVELLAAVSRSALFAAIVVALSVVARQQWPDAPLVWSSPAPGSKWLEVPRQLRDFIGHSRRGHVSR